MEMKKSAIVAFLVICLSINGIAPALASTEETEAQHQEKRNYLGCTPTFILMGMYGLVYARALNETFLLAFVAGYTNFDWSPIPFLKNAEWVYQNVYGGINITYFPLSRQIFPEGFYLGIDLVPSLGFTTRRDSREGGCGLDFSFDVLSGYSWILADSLKISIDVFLNFNPPGIHISGVNWNEDNRWTILPFFDVNLGVIF